MLILLGSHDDCQSDYLLASTGMRMIHPGNGQVETTLLATSIGLLVMLPEGDHDSVIHT